MCELSSTGSVTATDTFGPSGLISRHTASGSVFYAFDYKNSVAQRLNSSGSVLSTQTFDAYGTRLSSDGNVDPYAGFGGQAGYYTDWETGTASSALELLTFRYYDPSAGRFLNRDPIGHKGGANEYEYVNNGPVGGSDPSGLDPFESVGAALGACLAAILGNLDGQNNDPCNDNYNVCMEWVECVADAISAALGSAAIAYVPEGAPIIGCMEGLLSAALHVAGESLCEALFQPCREDASPACIAQSLAADLVLGCADGLLAAGLEEVIGEAKQLAEFAFESLIAAFSNGYEASNCKNP